MQEIHVPSSCQQKESLQFNTDSKPWCLIIPHIQKF
jgi:hypothetical protein